MKSRNSGIFSFDGKNMRMRTKINTVVIAGAGAMGSGIAQVFATAGLEVLLYDVVETSLLRARTNLEQQLDRAVAKGKMDESERNIALGKIQFTNDINSLKADMVVEAIVEKLEVKRQLFEKLAEINSSDTILASNTSSISITQIAKGIPHAERIIGMHFFNPAHIMKLVEVILGVETSEEVAHAVRELVIALGKTPVMCKDSPGFVVNRVARHYYVESLKIVEERSASLENIDMLMESAGFKLGPFMLMDLVGNDINFAVTSSLFASFHQDSKFRPSRIQQQKVEAGHLGKKSGKGFYNHT